MPRGVFKSLPGVGDLGRSPSRAAENKYTPRIIMSYKYSTLLSICTWYSLILPPKLVSLAAALIPLLLICLSQISCEVYICSELSLFNVGFYCMHDSRPRSERYPIESVLTSHYVKLILAVLTFISMRPFLNYSEATVIISCAIKIYVSGTFLYYILRLYKLPRDSSLLGGVIFAFSVYPLTNSNLAAALSMLIILLFVFSITRYKKTLPSNFNRFSLLLASFALGLFLSKAASALGIIILVAYVFALYKFTIKDLELKEMLLFSLLPFALVCFSGLNYSPGSFKASAIPMDVYKMVLSTPIANDFSVLYLGVIPSFLVLLNISFLLIAQSYWKNKFVIFWTGAQLLSALLLFNIPYLDPYKENILNNISVEVLLIFFFMSSAIVSALAFKNLRLKLAKKRRVSAAKSLVLSFVFFALIIYYAYSSVGVSADESFHLLLMAVLTVILLGSYFLHISGKQKSILTLIVSLLVFYDLYQINSKYLATLFS